MSHEIAKTDHASKAAVLRRRLAKINWQLVREIVLSLVICTYWFYAFTWVSPDSTLKERILERVRVWWNFWGFYQNWNLYSPVIRDINFHTIITMTFADGTVMVYQMPRMDKYNLYDRYRMEKFRKWGNDVMPWKDKYKEFWPDFARYFGRFLPPRQ